MAVKIPALLHKMSKAAQKAWYKKNNMEMPSTSAQTGGKSAAAAKRVKVAPRKASEVKPDSVRAINAARQAAYMAKGGRAPIGAAGSGGSSVMAGSNMSTAKGIVAGIKAGFNPRVSLNPYEGMTAKEKKAMKKEEVEQVNENLAKNPFELYSDHPDFKEAHAAISKAVSTGSIGNVMDATKKYRHVGARDTSSMEAIHAAMKKNKLGEEADAPHGYGVNEGSKRMSAAVKLQRAFDREKAASDASRKRGEEVLAQARAEYAKKQAAKTNEEVEQVDEGAKEDAEKLLGGPVKEKPKMPPGKQPAGYRYVRGLARKAMKAGMKKEEVEQVDEVDYKKYLKVSQEKRPLTPSAVAVAMSAEKEGNPNPARKLRNTQDARKFANKQLTKQVAKTRPAQKFPVYEPGRKYVGDSVELDGPVIDENNLKSLKKEDTEMKYIEEKLTAADPASKWISDFVKSDNPKFAGKSKKERIQQALGAYYAAKGGKNEEVEQIDEGATHWEYSGTVNGKDYSIKVKRGGDLSSVSHKSIMKQNPHLAAHEAKAVHETSGEDEEHVEVEHEGKKYTHHVTNHQEPRMVYGEEVEHVTEKYMGFKKVMAAAKTGGARNPAAVAAAIGRKKYGKEKFQAAAAAGKKLGEETVTEAEGKTPETDTEVSLAKMHGNPKKITYGDVVKARIASAKKKALNKG